MIKDRASDGPVAKRSKKTSTAVGMCVYYGEPDVPYEIVKTWLVTPAPGRQSIKVLLLQELRSVDAATAEAPAQDVVSINHGFSTVWEKHGLDAETELNAGMRQMHLEVVRRLAARIKMSEKEAYEILRWGNGKPAQGACPAELEGC